MSQVTVENLDNDTPQKLDDLAQIMAAYSQVTEKLQASHNQLSLEVVRLQRELASTNVALQRSKRLAALGEMAAGIAHEIRNPLAAIQLYATILVEDLPSESETGQTAGKIRSAVRGLEGIVSDVLIFSREMKLKYFPLEAQEVFERVIDTHQPEIQKRQIKVEIQIQGEVEFYADADLLQQALLNLVRNATQAAAKVQGTITLQAKIEESFVKLSVKDNGQGIGNDDVDRIFNPFFTTRNTGTGLGLAIVHRIVDAHAGTILVRNDNGAVFELVLPTQPVEMDNDGQTERGRVS